VVTAGADWAITTPEKLAPAAAITALARTAEIRERPLLISKLNMLILRTDIEDE